MKKKKIIMIIVVVWLFCGILNWGTILGQFTGEFPKMSSRDHYGIALFVAITGPFGTIASMFTSNLYQYGFVWK